MAIMQTMTVDMVRGPDGALRPVTPDGSTTEALDGRTPGSRSLYAIEKLDAAALNDLDPLWPAVFPLWADLADGAELTHDGAPIGRIKRSEESRRRAGDLALRGYELLVEQHGKDDDGETDDRWTSEGMAAMRTVLVDMAPLGSLGDWRGEREVRFRQAEAVGRAYGMAGDAVASVTERPFTKRRSLLTACSAARALEQRARIAAEAARVAKASHEAARVEAARPRTCRELDIEIISVDASPARGPRFIENPRDGRQINAALAPFEGAGLAWMTDTHLFFGFRRIAGLDIPLFDHLGVRVLGRDEPVPPTVRVREPTREDAGFAMSARARHCDASVLGPIAHERFSAVAIDRARALAMQWVSQVGNVTSTTAWRWYWALEAAVRGLLVRPDVAASHFVQVRAGAGVGGRRAQGHASPPDWSSDPLAEMALKFTLRGSIAPGALLEHQADAPHANHADESSKGKRKNHGN